MTENNAAQPPLTNDQIEALAKKHIAPRADRLDAIMTNPVPYQQTEQFRRVKALIVDVLSNLRAPVADERLVFNLAIEAAGKVIPAYGKRGDMIALYADQLAAVVALASAPNTIPTQDCIRWQAGAWDMTLTEVMVDGRRWYREDDPKLASVPVADEDDQPTAPDDDAIAECWVTASDCDGIAYDGPSFERGYRLGEIAERDRAALASSREAGEAPSRQTLLDAIWRHGNARAMAEHNIAYRDEVRNTADALIALFDASAAPAAFPKDGVRAGRSGPDGVFIPASQASADAFPPIDPVQAHVAHCAGCETCDGWREMLGSQRQASEAVRNAGIAASVDQLVTAAKGMTKLYPHVWDRTDGSLVVFPENVARFDAAFDALRIAVGEAVDDDETATLSAQSVLSSGAPNGRKRTAAERRAPMVERVYGTGVTAQPAQKEQSDEN